MARKASARDIAEFATGRASSSDKREMGFVKRGSRLVPGKKTPRTIRAAFKRHTKKKTKKKKG